MDLDAPGNRREVAYPSVPLILVAGQLAPAPSWWMVDMAKRGVSVETIETYSKSIELWFSALYQNNIAWHDATAKTAQDFIDALIFRKNRHNTIEIRIASVVAFYAWATTNAFLPKLPFGKPDLKVPKGRAKPVQAHSKDEFARIVANLPRKSAALRRRDELISESGRVMGLRRKEIVGMRAEQFEGLDQHSNIHVIQTDPAHTKGYKTRDVLVPRILAVKIKNYIKTYRQQLIIRLQKKNPKWVPPGNLFLTERGTVVSKEYITSMWKQGANAASIASRFHNNRSSLATHIADVTIEAGSKNPETYVKDILGHKDEKTSRRYIDDSKVKKRRLTNAQIINDMYQDETSE